MLVFYSSCSEIEKDEVNITTIELKQNIQLSKNIGDSTRYHIEFKLPQVVSYPNKAVEDEINFNINRYFFGDDGISGKDPRRNFERMILTLTDWYQNEVYVFKKEFPDIGELLNYELYKGGTVVYNRNKILTIACENYSYTGGAHGLNSIEYLHFDLNTGQQFDLDKLFDENGKFKLLKLVSGKCEEMKGEKNSELFEETIIESCNNFYFDDKNFYFVFNPYEIAPYSAGYISIQIPINELKPLLRKDIHPGFIK